MQPSARALRQFRRQNWVLLRSTLARLAARSTGASDQDAWFDPTAEADLRLERAVAADSYALDA